VLWHERGKGEGGKTEGLGAWKRIFEGRKSKPTRPRAKRRWKRGKIPKGMRWEKDGEDPRNCEDLN